MNKWIIICNSKYFNMKKAFEKEKVITWPQEEKISEGDIVYCYITSPYKSILYKCQVETVGLYKMDENIKKYVIHPLFYDKQQLYMRIKCLESYSEDFLTSEKIRACGVDNLQTLTKMPDKLLQYIDAQIKSKSSILHMFNIEIIPIITGIVITIIVILLVIPNNKYLSLNYDKNRKELMVNAIDESKIEASSNIINVGDVTDVAFIVGEYKFRGNESVLWKSSDESVATIDNDGIVTGVSVGTVTITGIYNGVKRKIEIEVKKEGDINDTEKKLENNVTGNQNYAVGEEKLSISCPTTILLEGDSVDVHLKNNSLYLDENCEDINWSTDNSKVASINDEGVLTAKSEGKCELIAKYNGKLVKQDITIAKVDDVGVTVSADYEKLSISSHGEDTIYLNFEGNTPEHIGAIAYYSSGLSLSLKWGEMNKNIVPLTIGDVSSEQEHGYVSVLVYEEENPSHIVAVTKIQIRIN